MMTFNLIVALPFMAAFTWSIAVYSLRKRVQYPPGPQAYPIIGSLFAFPQSDPWRCFSKAARRQDDLIFYHGLGNSILVLNSLESNVDLLVRRGSIYSGRPYFVVACEYLNLIKSVALLPIGAYWRLQRRFTRAAFNRSKVKRYEDAIEASAHALRHSLLQDPDAFVDHVRLATGRVLAKTIYGIEVNSAQDLYVSRIQRAMGIVRRALIPGSFLVDLIPALNYLPKWTPFLEFRREGLHNREVIAENVREPFEEVKQNMAQGIAAPSFTRELLTSPDFESDRRDRGGFELNLQWASASMSAAGQEVISSVILNIILAMVSHPDKLKKAQAEMKNVLGSSSPTFGDRERLPYVDAIIKETLRWRPPLPVSIVRASNEADFYRGYYIPKNTIIVPNIWKISRDCAGEYPPESFAPERFLSTGSKIVDPLTYVFGFGRRICPGRAISESALFTFAATILSLDIVHSVDENGQDIPIDLTYPSGFISFPAPFRCNFKLSE